MQKATGNHCIKFPSIIIMANEINNMALSPRQTLDGQRVLRIPGRNNKIRVGMWNVQGMFQAGALANIIREM